jgi:hypothetical protein
LLFGFDPLAWRRVASPANCVLGVVAHLILRMAFLAFDAEMELLHTVIPM